MARAAMLIGGASDPQKPTVALGKAIWSLIPPVSPTQPSTLAVMIEVDIPDQKMHTTVMIRKNVDASLPASHTIDLRATFADGAEIKGIKDIGLPQLRKEGAPSGDAVSGVRVKINDSYYLVGLTRSDADTAHNLDRLYNDASLDFPLLLNDDRIAKLTFEKGVSGDRVMAQAFNIWKESYTSEIPLQSLDGTLVVPVAINNALTLNFVIDSGATDVSIPADVVLTLIRTGTLVTEDFLGSTTYRLADGSTVPSAIFRIRSLRVGDREIENVVAGVAKVEGSLLLGQSFLNRFKTWSIDNQRQLLLLK